MKKKVQKRIIGRAAKMHALVTKREPHIGLSLFGHWHEAIARLVAMYDSWGPLTTGPYSKPRAGA